MTAGYLDRIRYLGALDDELLRARSIAAEPPDVTFVNVVLAQEVLFGVPLALNDGHLFHYEAGRQALTDREASPLLDLVERGYVTILSRNGDLADMPLEMRTFHRTSDWYSRRIGYSFINGSGRRSGFSRKGSTSVGGRRQIWARVLRAF